MSEFLSGDDAFRIARGINESVDLDQYFSSWQYLYDTQYPLGLSDSLYLDKLICDGYVLTPENREELQGVPYRGAHAYGLMSNLESDEQ